MSVDSWESISPAELALACHAEHQLLAVHDTFSERAVRLNYSRLLRQAPGEYVYEFARQLLFTHGLRWQAYEIIAAHKAAFQRLGEVELEQLGQGIDSWWTTDAFARTLSGPAWMAGQVPDELVIRWAHSPDLWWRRAALVSTVAFNVRSHGGRGDRHRTLLICELLVTDHADMVVKAMSWALRELGVFDPQAVQRFMERHADVLAGRVKREVESKLRTGLKSPRRRK